MAIGFQSNLVFRLLVSLFAIVVVIITGGTVITVRIAHNTLAEQGERQLALQKEQFQRQIADTQERLLRKLQPQIDMLVQFSKGPLVTHVNDFKDVMPRSKAELVQAFQNCFEFLETTLVASCIRIQTHEIGIGRTIQTLNRSIMFSAVNFLAEDEDIEAIYVEDWQGNMFTGVRKDGNGKLWELEEVPTQFPSYVSTVEREILDDEDYLGKVVFRYSNDRLMQMQANTETQLAEADELLRNNIQERSQQIVINQVIEGIFFASALLIALAAIAIYTILRPLKKLKESADQLALGKWNEYIDTTRLDEIGSLARSFAAMRNSIHDKISELDISNKALRVTQNKLEKLLIGTREIASSHDKFSPIVNALNLILPEIGAKHVAAVNIAFEELNSHGDTGYAHFQLPVTYSLNNEPSLKLGDVNGIEHFFSDQLHSSELKPSLLRTMKGSRLHGGLLTIPVLHNQHLLGLIEVDGIDEAIFENEDQHFIDTLSQALAVTLRNIDFTQELTEKIRMEGELATAAAVQQALFPKDLPQLAGLEMASYFQSASETGGDWYGFMTEFEDTLYVMIGDVTGHGTPAALVTATASATCTLLEEMYQNNPFDPPSPGECLMHLNRAIFEAGNPNFLMTFFFAKLDLKTGLLTFSNAGHLFPFLIRTDGNLKRLLNTNSRLGDHKLCEFSENSVQLQDGDTLLFYTDGLTENENDKEQMWGERRLRRYLKHNCDCSAQEIVDGLVHETTTFLNGQPLEDDMTLLCCRVLKKFENGPA